VLSSIDVECDRPMSEALCHGPQCGRCLKACPGDVIRHWDRDWEACDRYRSPHGFAQLSEYLGRVIDEPDTKQKKALLRSEDSLNLWQSILRGAGVITRPQKEARLGAMLATESAGPVPAYLRQLRWIGRKSR
jgi:ferredoxin